MSTTSSQISIRPWPERNGADPANGAVAYRDAALAPPFLHQDRRERATRDDRRVVIGLVNNMSDRGLYATERQFRRLLSGVSGSPSVHLRMFTFSEIARARDAQLHIAAHYDPIDALWTSDLDGLIVSGAEPQAAALAQEPYWPTLTKLVDWAEARTVSTVWSCLAAHAAVYHLSGIARRALPDKLSGLFECAGLGPHPLLEGLPSQWRVPHSRCNELAEDQLVLRGYHVLTRSHLAGADTFVRHGKALHVFLQGHAEYDWGTLSREYRRDVRRFLAGERPCYPEMPQNYFAANIADDLRAFRRRALKHRHVALLTEFPTAAIVERSYAPWADVAARFYANWLSYIARRKQASPMATLASAPAALCP
ncbi:MAG TPA: homoserine O-succinyltransferase [Stellaceae bacterium]|nr:homoserine O-succinyltransferase [Stellaceae bacterium]